MRQIDLQVLDVRGTPLPIIGFGTSGLPSDHCSAMVETALALGYRHIDTAQAYGNEAEVGRGIARSAVPRAEIFLSTKLEQVNLGAAAVRRATAESLARLGTDYVDLLMIHWPSEEVPMSETLAAFAHLRAEGKVRNIGVCNFTLDLLREAVEQHGADLLCNQVECHPLLAQKKILPYLQSNGIALVAYSPLGRGRVVRNPILRRIGAKYGKSSAQVSLAWLASQDLVAAIPKASSEAHCRANLEIFDFVLSADDLDEIAGLDTGQRGIDPSWAPNWD
ncbi:MAG: aldo/keto reductase [Gammaproteobacteria bacterium]|nr:aldo/keto reductase [Gammaproteobacteria bacterium]